MDIVDAPEFGAVRKLNVAVTPAAVGEDLYPYVDLETGSFGVVIVQVALAEQNSRVRFGITYVGTSNFEILWSNRPPTGTGSRDFCSEAERKQQQPRDQPEAHQCLTREDWK